MCPEVRAGEGGLDEGKEGEDRRCYNGEEGDKDNPVIVTPYHESTMKLSIENEVMNYEYG